MIWKAKRVLIVGLGGLAAPWLEYFSESSPQLLGLMDGDRVESSNLTRQFIHEGRVGALKTDSALLYLQDKGHEGMVELHHEFLTASNAEEIINEYDVILDGTDNFKTKYLINLTCSKLKKDLIYASGTDRYGQASYFSFAKDEACLSCLYPYIEDQEELSVCSPITQAWPLREIALKALELYRAKDSKTLWHFEAESKEWMPLNKKIDSDCLCQNHFNPLELFDDYRWDEIQLWDKVACTEELNLSNIPSDHPVVLTCESGVRARNLCFRLRQQGFTNIYWSTH